LILGEAIEGLPGLITDDPVFASSDADYLKGKEEIRTFFYAVIKLWTSFYQYLYNRVYGENQNQPLADLDTKAAKGLNLGWSFAFADRPLNY
jgi:hypothetical protein